jgi:polyisoprenoid-binding protein YceI
MKNKKLISLAAALIIVIGGAVYFVYDGLTGNHVEIESVIAQAPAENNSTEVSGSGESTTDEATPASNEAADVDGEWRIGSDSKVYFSVTTSRDTVNYELAKVTGSWNLNSKDAAQTKAEGTVEVTSMDSGNAQRDQHISEAEYLDTAQFPNATFVAKSFEGLPTEWNTGEVYDVSMTGELTVKGITKEVVFTGQTVYDQGSLKLEASTVVTFDDFGMKNPHTVVMDTENNLTVELRLSLIKG